MKRKTRTLRQRSKFAHIKRRREKKVLAKQCGFSSYEEMVCFLENKFSLSVKYGLKEAFAKSVVAFRRLAKSISSYRERVEESEGK